MTPTRAEVESALEDPAVFLVLDGSDGFRRLAERDPRSGGRLNEVLILDPPDAYGRRGETGLQST